MAFGQASGPPASGRQVKELLELLQAAGHADFRDARGPMGFSQRQAAGKFTAQEATEFIEQLQEAEYQRDVGEVGASRSRWRGRRLPSSRCASTPTTSSLPSSNDEDGSSSNRDHPNSVSTPIVRPGATPPGTETRRRSARSGCVGVRCGRIRLAG
jgi:hypothetical protein